MDSSLAVDKPKSALFERFIRGDELPPMVWVHQEGLPWRLVVAVGCNGLELANQRLPERSVMDPAPIHYAELHRRGYVWSPDRKVEYSFLVKEKSDGSIMIPIIKI